MVGKIDTIEKLENLLLSDSFKKKYQRDRIEKLLKILKEELPANLKLEGLSTILSSQMYADLGYSQVDFALRALDLFSGDKKLEALQTITRHDSMLHMDKHRQNDLVMRALNKFPAGKKRVAAFQSVLRDPFFINRDEAHDRHWLVSNIIEEQPLEDRGSFLYAYFASATFKSKSAEDQSNGVRQLYYNNHDWKITDAERLGIFQQIISMESFNEWDGYAVSEFLRDSFGQSGFSGTAKLPENSRLQAYQSLIQSDSFGKFNVRSQASIANAFLQTIPGSQRLQAFETVINLGDQFTAWRERDIDEFARDSILFLNQEHRQRAFDLYINSQAFQQQSGRSQQEFYAYAKTKGVEVPESEGQSGDAKRDFGGDGVADGQIRVGEALSAAAPAKVFA